ncbi:hypothetical protein BC567DRAFT_251554 [Phyllosticta citribraziliensis]
MGKRVDEKMRQGRSRPRARRTSTTETTKGLQKEQLSVQGATAPSRFGIENALWTKRPAGYYTKKLQFAGIETDVDGHRRTSTDIDDLYQQPPHSRNRFHIRAGDTQRSEGEILGSAETEATGSERIAEDEVQARALPSKKHTAKSPIRISRAAMTATATLRETAPAASSSVDAHHEGLRHPPLTPQNGLVRFGLFIQAREARTRLLDRIALAIKLVIPFLAIITWISRSKCGVDRGKRRAEAEE